MLNLPRTCKLLNVPLILHFPWSVALVWFLSRSMVGRLIGQYSSCSSSGSMEFCLSKYPLFRLFCGRRGAFYCSSFLPCCSWNGCGVSGGCCDDGVCDCCSKWTLDGVAGGEVRPLCGGDPDRMLFAPIGCWDCDSRFDMKLSSKSTDNWFVSIEPNLTSCAPKQNNANQFNATRRNIFEFN